MEINNTALDQIAMESTNEQAEIAKETKQAFSVTDIQTWLISYLSYLLEGETNAVDITTPFERYGLDSAAVVGLTGDMEDWLGLELDPTLLYDYPTIETLAQHLVEECKEKA